MINPSEELGIELLKALGIDSENVTKFTFHCAHAEIATVELVRYVKHETEELNLPATATESIAIVDKESHLRFIKMQRAVNSVLLNLEDDGFLLNLEDGGFCDDVANGVRNMLKEFKS